MLIYPARCVKKTVTYTPWLKKFPSSIKELELYIKKFIDLEINKKSLKFETVKKHWKYTMCEKKN